MPVDFHFLRPLWLLALLPLALLGWRLLRHRGDIDAWRGLVDPHLLQRLLVESGARTRRWPLALLAVGWLLLVLALAGPTWQQLPQPVYQARQYTVIVLDISPSMNAADVTPSRLAQARFEVLDMLRRMRDGQAALIAFGAEPYLVSPLTADVATIAAQVPSLETALLPAPGARRVDLALQLAGRLLQQAQATDGQVILVSDGLDDPGAASAAARQLAGDGYRVSVLGIGTPKGAPVPLAGGGFMAGGDGALQLSRLGEGALRTLATAGDGTYVRARVGEGDLQLLLPSTSRSAVAAQSSGDRATADSWREEGPWLLLVLLPLAALAFRRGWLSPLLILVAVMPVPPAHAVTWQDLWQTPDRQAMHKLDAGEAASAAEQFQRPDWRAAAHYRAGQYQQALDALQGIETADAAYNRGNALARLGRLDDALAAYDQALQEAPDNADARHNRELVRQLLEQQRRREQQSQATDRQQQDDRQGQQGQQGQQADPGQQEQRGGDRSTQAAGPDTRPPEESGTADTDQPAQHEGAQARTAGEVASQQAAKDDETPGLSDLLGGGQDAHAAPGASGIARSDPETEQAVQQMLRRVPDDPAGLLRQRFLLQYLRRHGQLP